jgi:two-component system nitrate/nitrite response regulator NarL
VNRFSIFLIDPDRLFREGIKRILDDSAYETVGEARSIEEARGVLGSGERVDLVALDVGDWEAAGIGEFLHELRARIEGVKVVVLTSDRSRGTIGKAIGWSVDAYLLKDMSPEALTRSLQLVMLGQQIFPTRLMASLLQAEAVEPASEGPSKGLSPREVQILRHLMNGYSNKAIARARDQRGDGEGASEGAVAQGARLEPHAGGRLGHEQRHRRPARGRPARRRRLSPATARQSGGRHRGEGEPASRAFSL